MTSQPLTDLPLFPLHSVLFPGGLLSLKVFEARYLDLVTRSMREHLAFGVVALRKGSEVRQPGDTVEFEPVGCLAELIDADSQEAGVLVVRCRGTRRFTVQSSRIDTDGLWLAQARLIEDDAPVLPGEQLVGAARALAKAMQTLKSRGNLPFLEPFHFEEAGWIANRWCEILPIPLTAKQKLMELPDPAVRLKLVDQFLRDKGIVK